MPAPSLPDAQSQLDSIGRYIHSLHDQIAGLEVVLTETKDAALGRQEYLRQDAHSKDKQVDSLRMQISQLEADLLNQRQTSSQLTEANSNGGVGAVLQQNDALTKQLRLMTQEIEDVMQKRTITSGAPDDY